MMKKQNEEGKGWALDEDETRRIQAYVDEQARDGNIRPGTPLPSITKLQTLTLTKNEITEEPEQMEESTETDTQHLSTPEGSEYDSTDDELEDEFDANHIQFAAEASKPVIKLIKMIARNHKNAFPVQNGKTYLHPFYFDTMLKRIRTEFWNHRLVPVTYDARTFVQEVPPMGSEFTPHGYLAPDGTFVNSSMRSCVVKVKHLYKEMHMAQTTATFLMEENEFINDYTRSQSTIKYVQNTMAEMNKKVPTDWETHYVNALKTHGYPPHATKNNGYAPNEEQSGN
jgi:DNA-binding transcriptional MocR family regulator